MADYLDLPNELEVNRLFVDYNMTSTQIKKDIAIIRKWMLTRSNLPEFPESKNGKNSTSNTIIF